MRQGHICLGIGPFGIQCVQELEGWLYPPIDLHEKIQYSKLIEHDNEQWGLCCNPEFSLTGLLSSTNSKQKQAFIHYLEDTLKLLVSSSLGLESYSVYVLLDATEEPGTVEVIPDHSEFYQLQILIEQVAQKMGVFHSFRGVGAVEPNKRNFNIHFVMVAPKITQLTAALSHSEYNNTRLFLLRLERWEQVVQNYGMGALHKIWVTPKFIPGYVFQVKELVATCGAMVRLLSKSSLHVAAENTGQQHFRPFMPHNMSAQKTLQQTHRPDWGTSPISFFTLSSASLPMGSIYKYGLFRSWYDGLDELSKRVRQGNNVDDFLLKQLSNRLEPHLRSFSDIGQNVGERNIAQELLHFAGNLATKNSINSDIEIKISGFESVDTICKTYDDLYRNITFVTNIAEIETEKTKLSDFLDKLDRQESICIDNISGEIESYIEEFCGQNAGLAGFANVEVALKQALESRYASIFKWESKMQDIDPMLGIEELKEATKNIPTEEVKWFHGLAIGTFCAALIFTIFANPIQTNSGTVPLSTTGVISTISLQDVFSMDVVLWIFKFVMCICVGYLISVLLYQDAYKRLMKALEYRKQVLKEFVQAGGDGPLKEMAAVSLEIRRERINRSTINFIQDMMGKIKAIRLEIGELKTESEQQLVKLNVIPAQHNVSDNISELVQDSLPYHKCLCPPESLVIWVLSCRKNTDNKNIANTIVSESWPVHQKRIFSDIPIGDKKMLYQLAYKNVEPLKENSPLSDKRKEEAKEVCHSLIRKTVNIFRLFYNPVNHQHQPVFYGVDSGERFLAVSRRVNDFIPEITADTNIPPVILDETPSKNDDYMFYACFWHDIHAEDLRRAVDPSFREQLSQ